MAFPFSCSQTSPEAYLLSIMVCHGGGGGGTLSVSGFLSSSKRFSLSHFLVLKKSAANERFGLILLAL